MYLLEKNSNIKCSFHSLPIKHLISIQTLKSHLITGIVLFIINDTEFEIVLCISSLIQAATRPEELHLVEVRELQSSKGSTNEEYRNVS